MKAGRELDALIAEKVMGWKKSNAPDGTEFWDNGIFCGGKWLEEWNPSINIADAWLVVEKFDTYRIQREQDGVYEVSLTVYKLDHDGMVVTAKRGYAEDTNLPETICKAALKAVGVEVEG